MTKHTGIRAYAFQCSYNSDSWLDNPTSLISALQSALSGITDLDSYARLIVYNVRNASRKEVEVEIDGITYLNKTELSASENDLLITDLETAFNGISGFAYDHVNIVNDIFREDATLNWPDSSYERV